jgi:hypothetical protein
MRSTKSTSVYISIEVNSLFTEYFSTGVLSKDPTVWLDGARPANTHIPLYFPGNMPAQPCSIPTTKKYICKYKNF